jgi:translation initiation factor 3 subunit M
LYNVLENPYGRFLIFKRVRKLAVAGKVTELVVPTFKRMDSFIQEWNVSESDKRDIFLSATNILKDQKGYVPIEAQYLSL